MAPAAQEGIGASRQLRVQALSGYARDQEEKGEVGMNGTHTAAQRRCARCREMLPVVEFARHGAGHQSYCRPCCAETNRAWRLANPQLRAASKKRSYWANPEKHRAAKRSLTPEQRALKNAKAKAYRSVNKPKVLMWNRLRRHRQRAAGNMPSAAHIGSMLCSQNAHCVYCDALLSPAIGFDIDHKRPVRRGGSNDISNLHLTCPTCNLKKQTKTHEEYIYQLGKST